MEKTSSINLPILMSMVEAFIDYLTSAGSSSADVREPLKTLHTLSTRDWASGNDAAALGALKVDVADKILHVIKMNTKMPTASQTDKSATMSDAALRKNLIRLAHEHPEFRKDILPLLKEAAPASNGGFPPDTIGEEHAGGSAEGEAGKGTVSDASKPWMKGEFTQQENVELGEKQEKGQLSNGKADSEPMKVASDAALRKGLIRLAHEHPEFRKDILPLLRTANVPFPSEMAQDATPKSKDQNKPETWYGLPPR